MKGAFAGLALAALLVSGPAPAAQKAALDVYVSTSADAPGARLLRMSVAGAGIEEIAFEENPVLTGESVASADPIAAPGGRGEVRLALTPEGARSLAEASSRSVGERLGIVVDGRLLAAPYLMVPLRDGVLLVAGLPLAEAKALAPRAGAHERRRDGTIHARDRSDGALGVSPRPRPSVAREADLDSLSS